MSSLESGQGPAIDRRRICLYRVKIKPRQESSCRFSLRKKHSRLTGGIYDERPVVQTDA